MLRTNLTEQFKLAVLNYHFSYLTLKHLIRNSIEYSFLKGSSLWEASDYQKVIPVCASSLSSDKLSILCQRFLEANQKADLQWKLEQQFLKFEQHFVKSRYA